MQTRQRLESETARLALLAVLFLATACATSGIKPGEPERRVVPITFPLAADSVRFTSGFGDPRDGGKRRHMGQDMFCPRWTPILAAVDGTVDWIATKRPKKEKGYELLLRGDDGNLFLRTLEQRRPGHPGQRRAADICVCARLEEWRPGVGWRDRWLCRRFGGCRSSRPAPALRDPHQELGERDRPGAIARGGAGQTVALGSRQRSAERLSVRAIVRNW